MNIKPQFITDENGKKISVILPVKVFEAIMEELEEKEDIRRYDCAKKRIEPSIPVEQAFEIIEARRRAKK